MKDISGNFRLKLKRFVILSKMFKFFSRGKIMRRSIFLLGFLCLAPLWAAQDVVWYPIQGREAERILIPGNPPLMVGGHNLLLNCVEFGFSLALTRAEEEALRSALMQEYLNYKGKLVADLNSLMAIWKEVTGNKNIDKNRFRLLVKEALTEEIARNSVGGLGKVISAIRTRQNEIVFSGTTKIDRRVLGAFREIIELALKLRDKRAVSFSSEAIAAFEKELITRIPGLSPEGRKWLANADFHRAIIERALKQVSPEEKETVKNLFIQAFAPAPADRNSLIPVDLGAIEIPPPNIFPLPRELPWDFR